MTSRLNSRWTALLIALMALGGLQGIMQQPPGATVPIHFGFDGTPNGWAPAWIGLMLVPGLTSFVWIALRWLSQTDPRAENLQRSARAVGSIWISIVLTLTLGQGFILSHTINAPFPTPLLQHLAPGFLIGSLLIGTGNVFGKLRSNHLIGIRSPWTLSSDRVWDQTHRFAGRSFVLGGALLIVGATVPGGEQWQGPMIAAVLVALIGGSNLKSYCLWRKEMHQS
jgi:uncharacterized membrane protein